MLSIPLWASEQAASAATTAEASDVMADADLFLGTKSSLCSDSSSLSSMYDQLVLWNNKEKMEAMGTHLYTWVKRERETVRVKCLAKEHKLQSSGQGSNLDRSIRSSVYCAYNT